MGKPERIQLSRRKGWRMPPNTMKVDRSTGYGNPFPISKGTQTTAGVTSEVWTVGTWEGPAMWFRDTKPEAAALSVEAFRAWVDQFVGTGLERGFIFAHGFEDQHFLPDHADGIGQASSGRHRLPSGDSSLGQSKALLGAHGGAE